MKYLNRPFSMPNLAQRNIGTKKKGFANALDYLETLDDLGNITAVIAQKDLRHPAKWWHNHSTIIISRFRDQLSTHGSSRNWTEASDQQSYESTD